MNRTTKKPPAEIGIRSAEMDDAAALASLMGELGYETTSDEMQMRLRRILPNSLYRAFVAVSHGKVCGVVVTGHYESFEHNDPSGRVLALVVSKTMRGHGVGRALMEAAEKDFVARNIKRIALNTRFDREDAHKFYETVGYTRTGFRFTKNL